MSEPYTEIASITPTATAVARRHLAANEDHRRVTYFGTPWGLCRRLIVGTDPASSRLRVALAPMMCLLCVRATWGLRYRGERPMVEAPQTLYHALGEDVGIRSVVDDFYGRVLADPQLSPYFASVDMTAVRR